MGNLIVKYVDENGKTLADSIITTEQIGTDYTSQPLDLKDKFYILIKTEGEETGVYTEEDIEVTYVYQFVGGRGGDEVPNTGIKNNYGLEIFFIANLLLLTSAIVLKKKYN